MKTLKNRLERPIKFLIVATSVTIGLTTFGLLINYFASKNITVMIIILASGLALIAFLLVLLEKNLHSSISVIEKNMRDIAAQIGKLHSLSPEASPEDSPIDEFLSLQREINGLAESFSRLDPVLKAEQLPPELEKRLAEGEILSRGEFNQAVYFLSQSNISYRSVYILAKIINKEAGHFKKDLIAGLKSSFSDGIICDFYDDTVAVYLPKVDSLSLLETKIRNFYVHFIPVQIDKNRKGLTLVQIKIGASVCPYSTRRDLERDAMFALNKAKDFYIYLPKVRTANLARFETLESISRMFLVNAETVISDAKQLHDFSSLEEYTSKNLLKISSQFGFMNAGYLLAEPTNGQYRVVFEDSRAHQQPTFRKINQILESDLKPIFDSADDTGALYGNEGDSVPPELGILLSNLDIKSFYFQVISANDTNLGILYFCSSEPHRSLTVNEQTILTFLGALFSSFIKNTINIEKADRANALLEYFLKANERYVYLIDRETHSLVYISDNLGQYLPSKKNIGEKCFKAMYGRDDICEDCPLLCGTKQISISAISPLPLLRSVLNYPGNPQEAAISISTAQQQISKVESRYLDKDLAVKNKSRLEIDFSSAISRGNSGYMFSIALCPIEQNASEEAKQDPITILNTICQTLSNANYDDLLYRLNENTLIVVFPSATHPAAFNMLEEIYKRIRIAVGNCEPCPHFSMALSQYPSDVGDALEIEDRLSIGHKNSLKAGTDMVYIFATKQSRKADREQYILDFIGEAAAKKNLETYIQPIIDLVTGHPIGGEVLIRLFDPNRGFIPPNEFVPLVSENKKMCDIEKSIISSVGELYKVHGFDLFRPIGVDRMCVNISTDSLLNSSFADSVKRIVSLYKLPKNFLQIEISEKNVLEAENEVGTLIKELSKSGVYFTLDHFTGRTDVLDLLVSLSFNCVKIDREIVLGIENDSESFLNFVHICERIRQFKLPILIEGIETESQANIIHNLGLTTGQGYYYAKPMSTNDYIKYLNYSK